MPLVDQNTMTESATDHRYSHCGITMRDLLQFFSSLLLPLMLGVFTIVITIQQQRVATEQRRQDLNSSAQQRAEDRQIAIDQRVQDKLIAREQREEDERRRLQDLKIAEEKRKQDDQLAEKQRDMLEKQRAHELTVEAARYEKETQKYLDGLLVTYMDEIGTLLMNNNGSLTSNPHIGTLVRAKTLTIARQLDSSRNTQLINFLYEAGQVSAGREPIDLRGVHFDGINLSLNSLYFRMRGLFLFGAHLNNASFDKLDLANANFSSAHLNGASFVDTNLAYVDFSHTILSAADFTESSISHTNFDDANMVYVKFSNSFVVDSSFTNTNMERIRIESRTLIDGCNFTDVSISSHPNFSQIWLSSSILKNVDLRQSIFTGAHITSTKFIHTNLNGSDFSFSNCDHSHFRSTSLDKIIFVGASLKGTIWTVDVLTNIDFTGADLEEANLENALKLQNVSFAGVKAQKMTLSNAIITNSTFLDCQCSRAMFIKATMSYVSFDNAILQYANFSDSKPTDDVTFSGIDGFQADFTRSHVFWCTFARSRLTDTIFTWASADYANFTHAELNGIDFSLASLQYAEITQEQVDLAMSISGTYYQGKTHRNPNKLMNSGDECNITAIVNSTFWQIKPSETMITMTPTNGNTCFFTVTSPVIMSQEIDVSQYRRLIDRGRAIVWVGANIWNTSTVLNITAWGFLELYTKHSFQAPERPDFQVLQPIFLIPQGTRRLLLSVAFQTATSRCGSIDLSVQDLDINRSSFF